MLFPHTEFYVKYIMCWPGQQAGLILLIHKHKHVHILDIKLLNKKNYISRAANNFFHLKGHMSY